MTVRAWATLTGCTANPGPDDRAHVVLYTSRQGSEPAGPEFSMEGLEPKRTYYWRVDQTQAGGSMTRGQVWSFTTGSAGSGSSWGGYPVDGNADVDTGDFLGWLHLANGDFLWSYELANWIFLPEDHMNDSGAWLYVFQ